MTMLPLACWALSAPGVAVALYQLPVDIKTLLGACGLVSVVESAPISCR